MAEAVSAAELERMVEELILGHPMAQGQRALGLEYERLVLHRRDRSSAPLEFCRGLMAELVARLRAEPQVDDGVIKAMRGDGFEVSMEPGGQLEVATSPLPRLEEIDAALARVDAVIEQVLAATDYRLECFGHAPVTPVEQIGLLPRPRYRIMDRRMSARGALARNMMRATAGFQLTYDVADRADAGRKMALLYRLSPALLALTANSRQVGGRDSGYASFRHRVWWDTDPTRSGVPEGCLDAETAVAGYVDFACRAPVLFVYAQDGSIVESAEPSLAAAAARGGLTRADVELHLSALFPFVRLRNYLEVRCFDSVEWSLARSVLALLSGLVYCRNAFASAWEVSTELVAENPHALRALHLAAARDGLEARAAAGGTLRDVVARLVELAAATLGRPSTCAWARPRDLDAVRARLAAGARPA
jgi:glutamate--cysteine ligase